MFQGRLCIAIVRYLLGFQSSSYDSMGTLEEGLQLKYFLTIFQKNFRYASKLLPITICIPKLL